MMLSRPGLSSKEDAKPLSPERMTSSDMPCAAHIATAARALAILNSARPFSVAGMSLAAITEIRSRRSEEHTSELQSLMRISYAVFCLKKKKHKKHRERATH